MLPFTVTGRLNDVMYYDIRCKECAKHVPLHIRTERRLFQERPDVMETVGMLLIDLIHKVAGYNYSLMPIEHAPVTYGCMTILKQGMMRFDIINSTSS